jgi:hypothetical protein
MPGDSFEVLHERVMGLGKDFSQDWQRAVVVGGRAALLAVADGHGSAAHFRSDLGSRWAVEEFAACAREFAERAAAVDEEEAAAVLPWRWLHDTALALPRRLVLSWRQRVALHEASSPADGRSLASGTTPPPDYEVYGSTFVGAVVTRRLLVCWQLGDGDIALVWGDGRAEAPLDAGPQLGDETESLCQNEAWLRFRVLWRPLTGTGPPPAVLLSTDGLSKSFADDDGFLGFASGVRERIAGEGVEAVREQLPGWLAKAARHSGDDTTLVGAFPVDVSEERGRKDDDIMYGLLEEGQRLLTEDGDHDVVGRFLGSGGEGEVYQASTPSGSWALKWYVPQLATPYRRTMLETLVHRGWRDDRFLWPHSIVTNPSVPGPGLGYLMPLRPHRFRDLRALLRRDPSVKATPRSLITVALHTVEAYRALHAKGIAYRDISWGNVFFDPVTGDVLVCDNDNAVVEGEVAGIAGTMTFMAPELVRGEAEPRIQTDLHSLAVLLFMLLMNHHPLWGAQESRIHCWDEKAERKLYGTDPVFVYDPRDARNRPVPGEQETVIATWAVLPQTLRELFVQTFTDGLRDPDRRVREGQWRDALSAVRDAIVVCDGCGKQNLTEPGGGAPRCWKCGRTVTLPMRLELTTGTGGRRGHRDIRLQRDAEVYAHHLLPAPERHDFTSVVGRVTEHPKTPGRLGLTNEGSAPWTLRRPDGAEREIEPGKTAALRPGILLEFGGGTEGRVRDR